MRLRTYRAPVHSRPGAAGRDGTGNRAAQCYQIRQRSVSERTIGDPALHPKAFANAGMFETGPSVRNCPSGCSFVLMSKRAASGR